MVHRLTTIHIKLDGNGKKPYSNITLNHRDIAGSRTKGDCIGVTITRRWETSSGKNKHLLPEEVRTLEENQSSGHEETRKFIG